MLKDIFTFIKRLVISFLISCFVGISGIFSGFFMCELTKGTHFEQTFCKVNGLMFGFVVYGLIAVFFFHFLSIKKKIANAWLFYLIFWHYFIKYNYN